MMRNCDNLGVCSHIGCGEPAVEGTYPIVYCFCHASANHAATARYMQRATDAHVAMINQKYRDREELAALAIEDAEARPLGDWQGTLIVEANGKRYYVHTDDPAYAKFAACLPSGS